MITRLAGHLLLQPYTSPCRLWAHPPGHLQSLHGEVLVKLFKVLWKQVSDFYIRHSFKSLYSLSQSLSRSQMRTWKERPFRGKGNLVFMDRLWGDELLRVHVKCPLHCWESIPGFWCKKVTKKVWDNFTSHVLNPWSHRSCFSQDLCLLLP